MGQSTAKRQFFWVFRGGLKLGLPFAGLYAAAMLAAAVNSFAIVARHIKQVPTAPNWYEHSAEQGLFLVTVFGGLVLAALLGFLYMKYLYRREETDFYHTLPVRRRIFFFGKLAAGLVCLWAPLMVGGVLRILLNGYMFQTYFMAERVWDTIGKWLLLLPLLAAVLGLALLAAALGRSLLQGAVFFGAMTGIWPVLYLLGAELIRLTVPNPNMEMSKGLMIGLSPVAAVFYHANYNSAYGGWVWYHWYQYAWWLIVAALLLLGAYKVYVNRKNGLEQAYAGLKTGLSLFVAVCTALFTGVVVLYQTPNQAAFYVLALLAGGVAYYACQMLFFHRLKLDVKRLLPLAAVPVLFVGYCIAVSFGLGLDIPPRPEGLLWSTLGGGESTGHVRIKSEDHSIITVPKEITKAVWQLEVTLLEAARERAYPYPMGARSYDDTDETQCIAVGNARGDANNYRTSISRYWISARTDMPAAQKARAMQAEVLTNQAFIQAMLPINAIDALGSIERADELALNGYFTRNTNAVVPEIYLDGLEDEPAFRQALEKALIADFTAGRQLDNGYYSKHADLPVGSYSYRLHYDDGAPFTARGGELNGKPAAGQSFRLDSSAYIAVTARMTETYALLEPLFEK